ncbi:MAG: hypothetical protein AAF380_02305, partial [Bacteroidota bacterium]
SSLPYQGTLSPAEGCSHNPSNRSSTWPHCLSGIQSFRPKLPIECIAYKPAKSIQSIHVE